MTNKLPPEAHEKLAESLRGRLQRQRLRPFRWFLAALAIIAIGAAAVRWSMRPAPPLPPMALVCFDAIAIDGHAEITAQLVAPGNPDANLAGFDIHWEMSVGDERLKGSSKTDASGIARYSVAVPREEARRIQATFLDPEGTVRRDDWGRIVPLAAKQWHLVSIQDVAKPNVEWNSGHVHGVEPKTEVIDRERLNVYTSGHVDALAYRGMRSWLAQHATTLPVGPLLHATPEEAASQLTTKK